MRPMSDDVGVLLVNLGTPDAPRPPEVRRYLRQFLSDPRVIDINPIARWLLLNLIILPFRPKKSAAAYEKIWTKEGSPLLTNGHALRDAVAERLGEDTPVVLAMRYGNPSIAQGLDELHDAGCDHVILLPLYPHYAASSTGSTLEEVYRHIALRWNTPFVSVIPPFYDDPGFIDAFAQVGRPILDDLDPQHILMSFHGLPERHMLKSDPSGRHCLATSNCCDAVGPKNRNCYRAQCYATARALAARLDLADDDYSVSFQSRLGRSPWIRPFTDERLVELAKTGVERLAVYCPAFVADCLETLEEIGMRADEDFRAAGGTRLVLIPSLNAHPAWADTVARLVRPRRLELAPPAPAS